MTHPLLDDYDKLAKGVDREFRRNKKLHGKRIQCRERCTDCCRHLFQITEIEAADISGAVKRLPADKRRELIERAKAYLPARKAIMQQHGYIEARGNLPKPETRLACPALVEGRCAIYEHRPVICRKYGMPLLHPDNPGRVFACELNFQPGEVISDARLVQIQTSIDNDWKTLQREFDKAGGRRAELPLTVADAIVRDCEEYLLEKAGKKSEGAL